MRARFLFVWVCAHLLCRWQGCTRMIWAHLWGNALTCMNGAGLMCDMIKAPSEALYARVWRELRLTVSWLALPLRAIRRQGRHWKLTLRTDHVLFNTQVCGKGPRGRSGQNRARQVRLGELVHIPKIEISTNFTLPPPKKRRKKERRGSVCTCVFVCVYLSAQGREGCCKKNTSYQHNELCFDSLLAHFAWGGCQEQMYKSDSHHYY